MPRLFATTLYLAHDAGVDTKELADTFGLPLSWVEEHIEAARLCLEKQVELVYMR